ncbi:MAG: hypothetical protein DHS20C10_03930 [marine bacterium B5-7]|nr:MAG: hypothetical protein DHS20C10_03930 [marine bacterium B5-7]
MPLSDQKIERYIQRTLSFVETNATKGGLENTLRGFSRHHNASPENLEDLVESITKENAATQVPRVMSKLHEIIDNARGIVWLYQSKDLIIRDTRALFDEEKLLAKAGLSALSILATLQQQHPKYAIPPKQIVTIFKDEKHRAAYTLTDTEAFREEQLEHQHDFVRMRVTNDENEQDKEKQRELKKQREQEQFLNTYRTELEGSTPTSRLFFTLDYLIKHAKTEKQAEILLNEASVISLQENNKKNDWTKNVAPGIDALQQAISELQHSNIRNLDKVIPRLGELFLRFIFISRLHDGSNNQGRVLQQFKHALKTFLTNHEAQTSVFNDSVNYGLNFNQGLVGSIKKTENISNIETFLKDQLASAVKTASQNYINNYKHFSFFGKNNKGERVINIRFGIFSKARINNLRKHLDSGGPRAFAQTIREIRHAVKKSGTSGGNSFNDYLLTELKNKGLSSSSTSQDEFDSLNTIVTNDMSLKQFKQNFMARLDELAPKKSSPKRSPRRN